MSCITEILKKKGNEEYLRCGTDTVIESGGIYKGYEYLITFRDIGFRCGYVAISTDHPLHKFNNENYDDLPVDCHGGVTFFEESHLTQKLLGFKCADKWIGFDAGHAGDAHDVFLMLKLWPETKSLADIYKRFHCQEDEIRTNQYMTKECKKVINQLIQIKNEEAKNVTHKKTFRKGKRSNETIL